MSATDELRKLLDERGVEWESEDCSSVDGKVVYRYTYWGEGNGATFCEPIGAKPGTLGATCDFSAIGVTPEQAIAATLGAGTCHWEYPQGVYGWVGYIVCSNCQHQFSGVDEREWTCCPVCGAKVRGDAE